jgi:hypothetical protein
MIVHIVLTPKQGKIAKTMADFNLNFRIQAISPAPASSAAHA